LLAARTGCVEVFLRIPFDLGRTAPARRNLVSELAQFVGEFGLINGGGELLRGEEALRLDDARLAVVALGDIENNRMRVQLGRDIAVDWAGCIVLKLGGYKFASGLGRMIAADAGLRVVFELVESNADALPVGFTDTLIAADESSSHPFGIPVIWNYIRVIRELFVADGAFLVLLDNLPVEKFPHFCWRPEFPISSRVMRIVNASNPRLQSARIGRLFPTAAGNRFVDWAVFIATKPHGISSWESRGNQWLVCGESGRRVSQMGCYNACPRGGL
jgi:hypothetical protein